MMDFGFKLEAWLEAEIYDKPKAQGNRIYYMKKRCHSPLRNFVRVMYGLFIRGTVTIVKLDGTTANIAYGNWCNSGSLVWCNSGYTHLLSLTAGDNIGDFGIVVGYGTAPVSPDDYKLDEAYKQGTGTGALDYDPVNILGPEEETVTIDTKQYLSLKIIVSRTINNPDSFAKDIYEIGLVAGYGGSKSSGNAPTKFLIFRDVLDTPLTIPGNGSAVLRYHLRWLIPQS